MDVLLLNQHISKHINSHLYLFAAQLFVSAVQPAEVGGESKVLKHIKTNNFKVLSLQKNRFFNFEKVELINF